MTINSDRALFLVSDPLLTHYGGFTS